MLLRFVVAEARVAVVVAVANIIVVYVIIVFTAKYRNDVSRMNQEHVSSAGPSL